MSFILFGRREILKKLASLKSCNLQDLVYMPLIQQPCRCFNVSSRIIDAKVIQSTARRFVHSGYSNSAFLSTLGQLHPVSVLGQSRLSVSWQLLRTVATWSSLGTAFNTQPERKPFTNLFGTRDNVGLFHISELTDYTGFYLLQQKAHARADDLVAEITNIERRRRPMVRVFDELSDCLCRVADMADFVRTGHPDSKFAQVADEACQSISSLVERLNVNIDVFNALKCVLRDGDAFPTDAVDQRVAELFLFDFEQSGIHLDEGKREAFVRLNENILSVGFYFMRGSQCGVSVPKDQLPAHLKHVFMPDGGDSVMVTGLFSENPEDMVREAAYRIYLYPDGQQLERLESLLSTRYKMAQLAGFESYAHRALRGTMGGTPERVMEFLQLLAEKIRPLAEVDIKYIGDVKRNNGGLGNVQPWDMTFYSGIARHQKCNISNSELAPYFSLGACMEGLGGLLSCLFKVTLQCDEADPGELWSDDVQKLTVVHETEGPLGHIYCDFFERSGKPHQDCHFTIQGGRRMEDGSYQRPMVVLMLNLPRPRGGGVPSLLTHSMVENLFHEFGHAMHSMLGRTRYQHVTGTRCPTDFAEVPSVLMEYFANDPRVLATFARHWQSGEPLSADKLEQLCRAKRMFNASETQLQVFYSILDQIYHGVHPLGKTTTEVLADVQNKFSSLPYVDGTAWQLRFSHFVGYGAKYYSYLMSRAVASQIWQQYFTSRRSRTKIPKKYWMSLSFNEAVARIFLKRDKSHWRVINVEAPTHYTGCFRSDPFSSTMGHRYRTTLLAHGGETAPAVLVENMLEKKPTTEMLVQALVDDLKDSEYLSR